MEVSETRTDSTLDPDRIDAVPRSDAQWFELIEPHIDVNPDEATSEDVIRTAKRHAEQVVERTDIDIDLPRIDWAATRELTRRHGYQRGNFVKLSLHSLTTNGWRRLMQTVRHELIHIWQFQSFRNVHHGDTFERWMNIMNVGKSGGRVFPKWTIHCPSCGDELSSRRREKDIARLFHENNNMIFTCRTCQICILEGVVKKEGEEVPIDDLATVWMPSARQKHVFLYDQDKTYRGNYEIEWYPATVDLTSLPGIGDATAERLGDDVLLIEDMVNGESLSQVVKDVVPNHHTALREEVFELYAEAMAKRSDEDIDQLRRVIERDSSEWWTPIEAVGRTGPLEKLCRALRDEVQPGDRLAIEFTEQDETVRATVQDNQSGRNLLDLRVVFEQPIGPQGDEGRLWSNGSSDWHLPYADIAPLDEQPVLISGERLLTERIDILD